MTKDEIIKLSLESGFDRYDSNCLFFAEAIAVAERKVCASMLELSDSALLLMAGEMTAQELLTVKAVLAGVKSLMLLKPARFSAS